MARINGCLAEVMRLLMMFEARIDHMPEKGQFYVSENDERINLLYDPGGKPSITVGITPYTEGFGEGITVNMMYRQDGRIWRSDAKFSDRDPEWLNKALDFIWRCFGIDQPFETPTGRIRAMKRWG